jgi:hypothetical protein
MHEDRGTTPGTDKAKPSIRSGSVKLVAVCIQWVTAIEDCASPVQRDVKCVCMVLQEVTEICDFRGDN